MDIAEDPAQGEESEGGARRARGGHSAATLGPLASSRAGRPQTATLVLVMAREMDADL